MKGKNGQFDIFCVQKLHGLDTNITNLFFFFAVEFYETAFGTYEVAATEKKERKKMRSTHYYEENKVNK